MSDDFGPCMDCVRAPADVAMTYASDGSTDLVCIPCLIARMAHAAEQVMAKLPAGTVAATGGA